MLFQYQKFEPADSVALDTIESPLSPVQLTLSCGPWQSGQQSPSYVHRLPSGATVTGWQREEYHVELLLCALSGELSGGAKVGKCDAGMWRVRALDRLAPLSFQASLLKQLEKPEIGPESGERLDAQSWTLDGQTLMLGTEDGDALAERAFERDWMPFRFKSALASRFPKYLPDGMTVTVPPLDSAELCQIQFLLAWVSAKAASDNSAYLAVDRQPEDVLKAAGCS